MNKSPAIILVSYHFYPSAEIGARRVTALARFLAEKGYRVLVVSEFGGQSFQHEGELRPNVIAVPVKRPKRILIDLLLSLKGANESAATQNSSLLTTAAPQPAATQSWLRRLLAGPRAAFFRLAYFIDIYKKWSWIASRAAVKIGKKYDAKLVLSSGPPHSMLLCGMLTAKRLGIPHIADLRDPWTDHVPPLPHSPRGFELKVLRRLERWVMRSSSAITSTSAAVAEILNTRYPGIASKMSVIRNGFDGKMSETSKATGGRLNILFAGELYLKRNPFPFLSALENLLDNPDVDPTRISVVFMGRCAYYGDTVLADWLKGKKAEAVVRIFPQMPPEAVSEAMGNATVLLNLAQQQPLSIPAKTFEHMASGRELLLVCENDSETAQLVHNVDGAVQVDPDDPAALARALRDLYQRHVVEGQLATPSAEQVARYSREAMNNALLSVMRSVARLD